MIDAKNPMMRSMTDGNFLAGLAIGALTTFVLTNPSVQQALFRTAARTVNVVKGGVAEAKERFLDAEAEVEMEAGEEADAG